MLKRTKNVYATKQAASVLLGSASSSLGSINFSTSQCGGILRFMHSDELIPTKKPVNRFSRKFVPFTRKSASEYGGGEEQTIESQKILIEGGYIKQISSGVYTFLPLGTKVLERLTFIIDKSLQKIGCEKIVMPSLIQSELWEETGRWQTAGKELFRLSDRKDHQFCLAPTHEECVTDVVRSLASSYKQTPLRLYQIGVKFRDELRPRYGLMRAKEFIMKDLYSFDIDRERAYQSYDEVVGAYKQIFDLLGLDYAMVEADTGNIGGDKSHEFQVLSDVGEDFICRCSCGKKYSANVEKGEGVAPEVFANLINGMSGVGVNSRDYFKETKPLSTSLDSLINLLDELGPNYDIHFTTSEPVKHLQRSKVGYTKTIIVTQKGDTVNDIKLKDAVKNMEKTEIALGNIVPYTASIKESVKQKSSSRVLIFLDSSVESSIVDKLSSPSSTAGGDVEGQKTFLRCVNQNDICINNSSECKNTPMTIKKGIEIGHVFYLGKKYSDSMRVFFSSEQGKRGLAEMGCYGIGVSRLIQSVAETHRTEKGIVWPMCIAPVRAFMTPMIPTAKMMPPDLSPEEVEKKRQQVVDFSEEFYHKLNSISAFRGEILFDDRLKERPPVKLYDGVKFGSPYIIAIGKDYLDNGTFEIQDRVNNVTLHVNESQALEFFEKVSQDFENQMSVLY